MPRPSPAVRGGLVGGAAGIAVGVVISFSLTASAVPIDCEVTTTTTPATTTAPATTTTLPAATTTTTTATATTTTIATTPPPDLLFAEDFHFAAADPASARAEFDRRFLSQVLGDNDGTWMGDHDMTCGAPTTQRVLAHNSDPGDGDDATPHPAGDEIWLCPQGDGHVMSDQGAADYSYTMFTPRRTFTGERRVCWDVNLTSAGRAWWHVMLLPAEVYEETGSLSYDHPDFPGVPDFPNERVGADPREAAFTFDFTQGLVGMFRGTTEFLQLASRQGWFQSTDKATRYRNCMEDTLLGVTFTQDRPADRGNRAGTYTWSMPGLDFPRGPVYVVFGAVNYNSGKEGTAPQTWHWDNIEIS